MTREEAVEHLKEWKEVISNGHRKAVIDMAIEALSTEAVHEWIPCSERLPNVGEDVLATDIDGDVDIETLTEVPRSNDIRWEDENGFYTDFEDIIAWQPIPKPYREDGE